MGLLKIFFCLRTRRSRRHWKSWLTLVTIFLCILFVSFQIQHPMYFRKFRTIKKDRTCTSQKGLRDIVHLTEEVHKILNGLNLTHFLLYGSHWGAMRVGGPLPWDEDADIGVIADANYLRLTKEKFINAFARKGMNVTDNMAQKTSLKLDRGSVNVDVIVYFDYNGLMQRRGWEPFLIPIHYRLHHSFPTWVVKTPPALPKAQFGKLMIPVPRGGREIMKHLYRYDWWKDYKPDYICDPVEF